MSSHGAPPSTGSSSQASTEQLERVLDHVRQALHNLRYGTVTIVVHEGTVVQVERAERYRFPKSSGRHEALE